MKKTIKKAYMLLQILMIAIVIISCNALKTPTTSTVEEKKVSEISQKIYTIVQKLDASVLSEGVEERFSTTKATNTALVENIITKLNNEFDEVATLMWSDYETYTLSHKNDPKNAVYVYKLPDISTELDYLEQKAIHQTNAANEKAAKDKTKPITIETTKNSPGTLITLSAAQQNFTTNAGTKFSGVFKAMHDEFIKEIKDNGDYPKIKDNIIKNGNTKIRAIFNDYYKKLLHERLDKL